MTEQRIPTIGDLVLWLAQYGEDTEIARLEIEFADADAEDSFVARTVVRVNP